MFEGDVTVKFEVSHNVCVTHGNVAGKDGRWRRPSPGSFCHPDAGHPAWRVAFEFGDGLWAIPVIFACRRDAEIAAQSIAPHFRECRSCGEPGAVVRRRGRSWVVRRMTENRRW